MFKSKGASHGEGTVEEVDQGVHGDQFGAQMRFVPDWGDQAGN